jgi:hypothetical protein
MPMQTSPRFSASPAFRRSWQALLTLGFLCACIALIGWLQWPQLQALQNRGQTASATEIQRDVERERVRLAFLQKTPTFGFDNLIADWTFLNFLQYFGDAPAREKTDYSLSPDYFEVILRRDPYFLQAYTFLSTSTSLYAGLPERSVQIMQESLKSLERPNVPPESFFAWRQLGIDQLLFLGDGKAARESFLQAADWATQSPLPGSREIAALSQQTADFLAKKPDSRTAQVAAWAMVLSNAPDDRTRQTATQRIEALGGKVMIGADGTLSIQPPARD